MHEAVEHVFLKERECENVKMYISVPTCEKVRKVHRTKKREQNDQKMSAFFGLLALFIDLLNQAFLRTLSTNVSPQGTSHYPSAHSRTKFKITSARRRAHTCVFK